MGGLACRNAESHFEKANLFLLQLLKCPCGSISSCFFFRFWNVVFIVDSVKFVLEMNRSKKLVLIQTRDLKKKRFFIHSSRSITFLVHLLNLRKDRVLTVFFFRVLKRYSFLWSLKWSQPVVERASRECKVKCK